MVKGVCVYRHVKVIFVRGVSDPKRRTRLVDLFLIILGIVLFICGFYTWQSFNSISGTFLSVLENQGYNIPASVSIKFRQITLVYLLVTAIGCLLVFVGAVNEATSFFEVK